MSKNAILEKEQIESIGDFEGSRVSSIPANRLEEVRKRARAFHDKVMEDSPVLFYKTIDLIRVPYPTKYGLRDAFSLPTPYMHILNRLFIIRYKAGSETKTLLFSPSDIEGNRATPFFARIGDGLGPLKSYTEQFLAPKIQTVEEALESAGIKPEEVDFISYDHLHTQDLRKWLGTSSRRAFFPNAKLLVMREEWDITKGLLPIEADWYCPNGTSGISEEKIIFLEGDVRLGEGLYLMKTVGHTAGNHSLVARTPEGVMVSSENGVCADSYAPLKSAIPGVRDYAQTTGFEVILNGNTLELATEQYISMVQEKEVAGKSSRNPDFYNFVPSSEMTAYWAFPGVSPTFTFGPRACASTHGPLSF